MKGLYEFLKELGLERESGKCEIKESNSKVNESFSRKRKLRQLTPRDLLAQRASFFRIYTSMSQRDRLDLL